MSRIVRTLLAAVGFGLCLDLSSARAATPDLFDMQFESPMLSEFNHAPTFVKAQVVLPDSYDGMPERRYPTIYLIHAFNENYRFSARKLQSWQDAFRTNHAEFILVSLDAALPSGHHEFADSVNNGPWGTALTSEFLPEFESNFRAISSPAARYVTGHSSGGWSALWLQVNYPDTFGGAWSAAPDPVDFHDFTGPDLTLEPPQNLYRDARGRLYGFVRSGGSDTMTLRDYVSKEDRRPGGQFDSFDAVFSPRGADGRPERLFDHRTGVIDPAVERYWEEHYDIARLLKVRWPELGPKLRGKLHVVVGTWDTFHLDGPVRLLAEELKTLGSDAEIDFARHYDHFNIYDYDGGLLRHDVREMKRALERAGVTAS